MRIAIANHTAAGVAALQQVLAQRPEYAVVWVTGAGTEAVARCRHDPPDVLLLDVLLPDMDGVETTRQIMTGSPCAILVVTATVSGCVAKVFDAMGYGALAAVDTPVLGPYGVVEGAEALLARLATIGKLITTVPCATPHSSTATTPWSATPPLPCLVCIGASTGGPQALAHVLSRLPAPFPGAFVVIQHVDVQFAPALVTWLAEQTPLPVRLVQVGARPEVGTILVAGTNDHLVLTANLTFNYTPEPRRIPYRRSVDVCFKSIVRYWPGQAIGVLLTGMGKDGAEGLLAFRQAGWHTIAQDQASSVVYGMPKAAAEAGAAVEIMPLVAIAPALERYCLRTISRCCKLSFDGRVIHV